MDFGDFLEDFWMIYKRLMDLLILEGQGLPKLRKALWRAVCAALNIERYIYIYIYTYTRYNREGYRPSKFPISNMLIKMLVFFV